MSKAKKNKDVQKDDEDSDDSLDDDQRKEMLVNERKQRKIDEARDVVITIFTKYPVLMEEFKVIFEKMAKDLQRNSPSSSKRKKSTKTKQSKNHENSDEIPTHSSRDDDEMSTDEEDLNDDDNIPRVSQRSLKIIKDLQSSDYPITWKEMKLLFEDFPGIELFKTTIDLNEQRHSTKGRKEFKLTTKEANDEAKEKLQESIPKLVEDIKKLTGVTMNYTTCRKKRPLQSVTGFLDFFKTINSKLKDTEIWMERVTPLLKEDLEFSCTQFSKDQVYNFLKDLTYYVSKEFSLPMIQQLERRADFVNDTMFVEDFVIPVVEDDKGEFEESEEFVGTITTEGYTETDGNQGPFNDQFLEEYVEKQRYWWVRDQRRKDRNRRKKSKQHIIPKKKGKKGILDIDEDQESVHSDDDNGQGDEDESNLQHNDLLRELHQRSYKLLLRGKCYHKESKVRCHNMFAVERDEHFFDKVKPVEVAQESPKKKYASFGQRPCKKKGDCRFLLFEYPDAVMIRVDWEDFDELCDVSSNTNNYLKQIERVFQIAIKGPPNSTERLSFCDLIRKLVIELVKFAFKKCYCDFDTSNFFCYATRKNFQTPDPYTTFRLTCKHDYCSIEVYVTIQYEPHPGIPVDFLIETSNIYFNTISVCKESDKLKSSPTPETLKLLLDNHRENVLKKKFDSNRILQIPSKSKYSFLYPVCYNPYSAMDNLIRLANWSKGFYVPVFLEKQPDGSFESADKEQMDKQVTRLASMTSRAFLKENPFVESTSFPVKNRQKRKGKRKFEQLDSDDGAENPSSSKGKKTIKRRKKQKCAESSDSSNGDDDQSDDSNDFKRKKSKKKEKEKSKGMAKTTEESDSNDNLDQSQGLLSDEPNDDTPPNDSTQKCGESTHGVEQTVQTASTHRTRSPRKNFQQSDPALRSSSRSQETSEEKTPNPSIDQTFQEEEETSTVAVLDEFFEESTGPIDISLDTTFEDKLFSKYVQEIEQLSKHIQNCQETDIIDEKEKDSFLRLVESEELHMDVLHTHDSSTLLFIACSEAQEFKEKTHNEQLQLWKSANLNAWDGKNLEKLLRALAEKLKVTNKCKPFPDQNKCHSSFYQEVQDNEITNDGVERLKTLLFEGDAKDEADDRVQVGIDNVEETKDYTATRNFRSNCHGTAVIGGGQRAMVATNSRKSMENFSPSEEHFLQKNGKHKKKDIGIWNEQPEVTDDIRINYHHYVQLLDDHKDFFDFIAKTWKELPKGCKTVDPKNVGGMVFKKRILEERMECSQYTFILTIPALVNRSGELTSVYNRFQEITSPINYTVETTAYQGLLGPLYMDLLKSEIKKKFNRMFAGLRSWTAVQKLQFSLPPNESLPFVDIVYNDSGCPFLVCSEPQEKEKIMVYKFNARNAKIGTQIINYCAAVTKCQKPNSTISFQLMPCSQSDRKDEAEMLAILYLIGFVTRKDISSMIIEIPEEKAKFKSQFVKMIMNKQFDNLFSLVKVKVTESPNKWKLMRYMDKQSKPKNGPLIIQEEVICFPTCRLPLKAFPNTGFLKCEYCKEKFHVQCVDALKLPNAKTNSSSDIQDQTPLHHVCYCCIANNDFPIDNNDEIHQLSLYSFGKELDRLIINGSLEGGITIQQVYNFLLMLLNFRTDMEIGLFDQFLRNLNGNVVKNKKYGHDYKAIGILCSSDTKDVFKSNGRLDRKQYLEIGKVACALKKALNYEHIAIPTIIDDQMLLTLVHRETGKIITYNPLINPNYPNNDFYVKMAKEVGNSIKFLMRTTEFFGEPNAKRSNIKWYTYLPAHCPFIEKKRQTLATVGAMIFQMLSKSDFHYIQTSTIPFWTKLILCAAVTRSDFSKLTNRKMPKSFGKIWPYDEFSKRVTDKWQADSSKSELTMAPF